MARRQPPVEITCDHCGDLIEPGDELPVNRFQSLDETGRVLVEAYFPLPDLHASCGATLLARPLKDWIGAPRTRGPKLPEGSPALLSEALETKVTVPAEASQPAPDAPKKSRKGTATSEQAD